MSAPAGQWLADAQPTRAARLRIGQGRHWLALANRETTDVVHQWYRNAEAPLAYRYPRLSGEYHGSGCTLAASIAGLLAQGLEPFSAIHEAQEYTWQALAEGYRIGMGQQIPNRLFWARGEEEQ